MDVVYPVKNVSSNDFVELRYSLRSLKNLKHDKVIIVGGHPDWLKGVSFVEEEDISTLKGLNTLRKIKAAANVASDDFILMNDDIFLMKPQEIKYYHQGKLKENVERKAPLLNYSRYWQGMHRVSILFKDPLDYELHYPFIFNKNNFFALLKKYDMTQPYSFTRSLYGNEYNVGGEYLKDNKVYTLDTLEGELFVSSSDQLPVDDAFVQVLDRLFPEKSPYEK
jgi:hypothetical protein